jgi:hypothetical protein
MLISLMQMLGLKKPSRKKIQLPEGLLHLEIVTAKGWWS